MAVDKKGTKQVAANKKAWHDYFVEEKYEAGIELAGTEVKSIRQGHINLKDSYCTFKDGEIFVRGMHISPYEKGNIFNKDPLRVRRLLMHKKEIVQQDQTGRLFGHSAGGLLQKLSCQAGNRSVQGQKAARQARQYRSPRCKARNRPSDERA